MDPFKLFTKISQFSKNKLFLLFIGFALLAESICCGSWGILTFLSILYIYLPKYGKFELELQSRWILLLSDSIKLSGVIAGLFTLIFGRLLGRVIWEQILIWEYCEIIFLAFGLLVLASCREINSKMLIFVKVLSMTYCFLVSKSFLIVFLYKLHRDYSFDPHEKEKINASPQPSREPLNTAQKLKSFLTKSLDLSPHPQILWDSQSGDILHRNPAFEALFRSGSLSPLFDSLQSRSDCCSLSTTVQTFLKTPSCVFEDVFVFDNTHKREFWNVTLTKVANGEKVLHGFWQNLTQVKEEEERRAEEKFKSLLTYSVAHEVKTPLNGLINVLETIIERFGDEYVDDIRLGLGTALLLQNRLMMINDYIHIMSGNFQLNNQEESPEEILARARSSVLYFIEGKNPQIENFVEPTVPHFLSCDRERIETVLFHLLWNALKYSQAGKCSSSLQLSATWRFSGVRFSVCDNGSGISDQKKRSLFRFKSRDGKKLASTFGEKKTAEPLLSNLGLTICQKICKEMGTELKVDSEPGKGSTFSFEIQVSASENEFREEESNSDEEMYNHSFDIEEQKPTILLPISLPTSTFAIKRLSHGNSPMMPKFPRKNSHSHPNVRSASVKNIRHLWNVLIVDDCLTNRMVMKNLVRRGTSFVLDIDEVTNGEEAVIWVKERINHRRGEDLVIFMDIEMPVMDGLEATRLIRRENPKMRVVVAAVTAFDTPEMKQSCINAGMDYFFKKPLRMKELQNLFNSLE